MTGQHDRHGEPTAPRDERGEAQPEPEFGPAPGPGRCPEQGGSSGGAAGDSRPGASEDPRERADTGMDLDALDEDALRALLRDSVRDLEPSPDALEHLRWAVPARRARRRQVVVGAAAAALVCSVAVPAMLHADFGRSGDKPMHNAGHAQDHVAEQQDPGDGLWGEGPAGGDGRDGGPLGGTDGGGEAGAPVAGSSAGPDPSSSLGPVSPSCTRKQLVGVPPVLGEADSEGRVYGSFTVVNVSPSSCTVEGDGIVRVTAQGAAKSTMIQVLDHTTGDEATGLPDPVMTPSDEVVLEPNAAYVVEFAWIPREGGGTTGCAASSPAPGGSEGTGGQQPMGSSESLQKDVGSGDTSGSGGDGVEGGDGTDTGSTGGGGDGGASGGTGGGGTGGSTGSTGGGDDPGTAPAASVLITHTPDVGDPAAGQVVIEGACAGTVYRTGVLPAA